MFGPGVLAVSLILTSPVAHGADCLAYLAADKAARKAYEAYQKAYEKAGIPRERAEKEARAKYRRALAAAQAASERARKEAKKARERAYAGIDGRFAEAKKAAYAIYDKSLPPGVCRSIPARLCNPMGKGRSAEAASARRYRQAVRRALLARDKAKKKARQSYNAALRDASYRLSEKDKRLGASLESTRLPSMEEPRRARWAARRAAKRARDDAYIAAYANPGPYRRKVGRYDRDVVLKAARYERSRRCPKW